MTLWADEEMAAIDGAEELQISTRRADGNWSGYTPIWVVRVGAELLIRSYRGPEGGWYQRARRAGAARIRAAGIERAVKLDGVAEAKTAAIDHAYRTKYGRHGSSYVATMTQPSVRATTLRLTPS